MANSNNFRIVTVTEGKSSFHRTQDKGAILHVFQLLQTIGRKGGTTTTKIPCKDILLCLLPEDLSPWPGYHRHCEVHLRG